LDLVLARFRALSPGARAILLMSALYVACGHRYRRQEEPDSAME
jgi:hypothetical protein